MVVLETTAFLLQETYQCVLRPIYFIEQGRGILYVYNFLIVTSTFSFPVYLDQFYTNLRGYTQSIYYKKTSSCKG